MVSISAKTFAVDSQGNWLPDPFTQNGGRPMFRHVVVKTVKERLNHRRDYLCEFRADGTYEIMRRSERKKPGERWPLARVKVAAAILYAIFRDEGNPWAYPHR